MTQQKAVRLTGPVTGGSGWPFAAPPRKVTERLGCVVEEFFLEGVAGSYEPAEGTRAGPDGIWTVVPGPTAEYKTRIYVVRPEDPAKFNGVLVVNWLNVSAGIDMGAPTEHEMAAGYAWVGVSAQRIGVHGQRALIGEGHTKGLRGIDPDRYGTLAHPGDAHSYDIFTHAARAVSGDRSTDDIDPLGGLRPEHMIATGSSQSTMRLGAYLNMVDEAEPIFDGYFLLTHWGICSRPPAQHAGESLAGPDEHGMHGGTSAINDRGRVRVLALCSETETMWNVPVRQPNTPTFCYWDMAGTSHIGAAAGMMYDTDGTQTMAGVGAQGDANLVEWGYVRDAAFEHLVAWVRDGTEPPSIPPIEATVDGGIVRDDNGNAVGGIRMPDVEAPTGMQWGDNGGDLWAMMSGRSTPYTDEQLAALYTGPDDYLAKWDAAVERLHAQGLVLDDAVEMVCARGRAIAADRWPTDR